MTKFQRISMDATTDEREPVDASKLLAGSPQQMTVNQFTNARGNFFVGVWGSDAGTWRVSYSEDEFCTILEGEAILTDKDGHAEHLKAGDSFTIASGFCGTWQTIGSVKKALCHL